MGYKTNITKEFKSKGFINGTSLFSTEKQDEGAQYEIQDILNNIGGDGDEVEFSIKVKDQYDSLKDV